MSIRTFDYPAYRWEIHNADTPSIHDGRGPERTDASKPAPKFKRRAVGFTADLEAQVEPLVWNGDDS